MVQRKAPSKLGVQADHVKSEKRSGNLKPNSCQHQEGKNRGPDMKKKMKRSRSIKLSDIESLKSSSPPPLRKSMPQPGKPPPPPLNAPATEATPQKQLIIKTTDGSPNYMKSTSSSEARKERSLVALCEDVSAQTSTCSSTLKDSKFPPYLMLNPGGTESEGTSVVKVCPYTYCSLNGHHHKPVPPLKCFLKARRHSLKVQKSMKWEVLSPRRARPSGEGTEEIHGDRPMIQETGKDFFIEFFSKDTEDGAFSGEPEGRVNESCFYTSHEAAGEQDGNNQVSESSSDESQESEIDFEENFNDTDAPETDERDGDADTCSSTLSGEEATMGSCENWSDSEGECQASMEEDDDISEESDMEWEQGQLSTSEVVTEADDLNKPDEDEFGTKVEGTPETKKPDWHEDSEIIISDDAVSNCTEEILADEVLQELFAEETTSSDMQCSDSDSESDGIPHYWEILESIQGARDLAYDQESSAEDAFEALKTEEAREKNQDEGVHEMENDVNETLSQIGDDENDCTADISVEVLNGHQEDTSLQTDHATMRLQNQIADSPQISDKMDMVGANKDESIDQKIEVSENNQDFAIAELPYCEAGDATEDQDQVANAELTFEIDVSDSTQSVSDADQGDTTEACQLDGTVEDSSSSQDLVNHSTSTEPHNHQLDEHDETNNVLESQNLSEEDQDETTKIKILTAMDFEKINLTEDDTRDAEKTEVEVCNESDVEESLLSANNGTSTGSKRPFVYTRGNPDPELHETCNNRKWTFGDKKPIMDLEEEREFNPREPNFLPVVPDPEAEKVDLRHQMMDERKNSEEWMIDYALRQTVTKLAPARKRKVALLVEAFENVLPAPKYETRIRHTPAAFSHTRTIQACS
ncbi:CALMODULIN-BINDING PROTEIN-RELATED [Salix viminalis]|uniref:CALMODULIN-BINDING PROTEIN-RELATED n=1 Tax=Salix viminalis TaxID=40686 RepID=A0A9Q0TLN2_SALVM|nr:CALMODULIN-BINDING PROTEIN-RELATED [Salix viminalis]